MVFSNTVQKYTLIIIWTKGCIAFLILQEMLQPFVQFLLNLFSIKSAGNVIWNKFPMDIGYVPNLQMFKKCEATT